MDNELTASQKLMIEKHREVYFERILNIGEYNHEHTMKTLKDFYNEIKIPMPTEVIIETNPRRGAFEAAKILYKTEDVTEQQLEDAIQYAFMGTLAANWIATFEYSNTYISDIKHKIIDILAEMSKNVGPIWWFENTIIITKPHIAAKGNRETLLVECSDGPALEYEDGKKCYIYNNKRYDSLLELRLDTMIDEK